MASAACNLLAADAVALRSLPRILPHMAKAEMRPLLFPPAPLPSYPSSSV